MAFIDSQIYMDMGLIFTQAYWENSIPWNMAMETLTDTALLAYLIISNTSTYISWFPTLLDKPLTISPKSTKYNLSNLHFQ